MYASVSMNEQVERGDVSQLTKARRWKRAAQAKAEEAELFADSFDDEVGVKGYWIARRRVNWVIV